MSPAVKTFQTLKNNLEGKFFEKLRLIGITRIAYCLVYLAFGYSVHSNWKLPFLALEDPVGPHAPPPRNCGLTVSPLW